MRYIIKESATGDELGSIEIVGTVGDYYLLEQLVEAGYLDAPADFYEIVEGAMFTEPGDKVVQDEDGPVLVLEPADDYDDEDETDTEDDTETEESES